MSLVDVKELVVKDENYKSIVSQLESIMLSLYKTHKGEIQPELFDAYPYEVVGDLYDVVKKNFKSAIVAHVKESGKADAEMQKILSLAFHLSFHETSRVAKTFYDFIQSRIYVLLAQNGFLEKITYEEANKDNELALLLSTGEEDDIYRVSPKYNSYEKIVEFFASEIPYTQRSADGVVETTKPIALHIADIIAQMNNVAIASMKSRIRQKVFQERLDRMNDFNMKSSLIELLHVYQEFKEEEKKKAA